MSNNTQNPSFKATVLTAPSRILVKNNEANSQYVMFTVQFTEEGPMKGATVGASFTILNAKGESRPAPNKGDEVTVYASVVNNKPLFNIGGEIIATNSDEDILARLAMAQAGQTV